MTLPSPCPGAELLNATTLLRGVVGSHAYGLNRPDSDVDRLAVVAMPTSRLHGLHLPTVAEYSYHRADPNGDDITLHEIAKFLLFATQANPNVCELLWLDRYEIVTTWGHELLENRHRLISATHLPAAYLGFLGHKAHDMEESPRRRHKHALHAYRLSLQAIQLWATGELCVRLTSAQIETAREFQHTATASDVTQLRESTTELLTGTSALPTYPDWDWVEAFLQRVRRAFLN